ncbi:MAG: TROVE domain-containing protein [Propionibacteriaceae bacterium]|jgi:60 kDa SS-A/Ro ribonucleoprotein|nr:TROVE domain-containing protein [Propionibacteriaceae bacterium]
MGITDALRTINVRATPQSAPASAGQVVNSAGGFVFTVDDRTRLRRFLTLGTEAGSYYVTERELTKQNARFLIALAQRDPRLVVDEAVAISLAGRAPKQNPTLFALAVVAGVADEDGRAYALSRLAEVARTGTHLALFVTYVQQFRGWGRGLRRAVGQWYSEKTPDAVAYQTLKYRSREGWTPRDLLRKSHPVAHDEAQARLFDYITHGVPEGGVVPEGLPALVAAYEEAKTASVPRLVELIAQQPLSWEMLPTEALASREVWEALIEQRMPVMALMRQLSRLTRLGVLDGACGAEVARRLSDRDTLVKARVHPISVLVALRTYASGRGARGSGTWEPIGRIVDALDAGFYAAFQAVEPTGKRTLLALDVSGSMVMPIGGTPLTCRDASAALALVTAATEPDHEILGFTAKGKDSFTVSGGARSYGSAIARLPITPRQRLDDVIKVVDHLPFAGTDCALPMLWATEQKTPVDTFVVYTDNETWAGDIHPRQALRQYREVMGIPAKLVVVGMTATQFTIADPDDAGMLDVAGFDASVPTVIADFSSAEVPSA